MRLFFIITEKNLDIFGLLIQSEEEENLFLKALEGSMDQLKIHF